MNLEMVTILMYHPSNTNRSNRDGSGSRKRDVISPSHKLNSRTSFFQPRRNDAVIRSLIESDEIKEISLQENEIHMNLFFT